MNLACINTCDGFCQVLIRSNESDVLHTLPMQTGHDRALADMTRHALAEAKLTAKQLTHIAVAVGPGGFTGVRIGVSFARGLGLVTGAPVIGVSLLEVLAMQARTDGVDLGVGIKNVGRGQVAWALVSAQGVQQKPIVCQPAEFAPMLAKCADGRNVHCVGDQHPDIDNITGLTGVCMSIFADLATTLKPQTNPATPWYVRPPDAKLPKGIDPWA